MHKTCSDVHGISDKIFFMMRTKEIDKPLTLSDNVVSEATIVEKGGVPLSLGGNGPQLGTIDFAGGKIYPVTRCLFSMFSGFLNSCFVISIMPMDRR